MVIFSLIPDTALAGLRGPLIPKISEPTSQKQNKNCFEVQGTRYTILIIKFFQEFNGNDAQPST